MLRIISHIVKSVLPLLLLFFSVAAVAQSRFEGALRGGASMLMYQSDYGKMQPSYNFGVDLLYTYRSPKVVAFRLGVALDYSQSRFGMSNYSDSTRVTDYATNYQGSGTAPVGGDLVDVKYTIGKLSEAHNQLYVSVPLQVGFYIKNFAIFVGPKLAFPMKATYRQDLTDVDVQITYPTYKVTVPGNQTAFDYNHESDSRYTSVKGDIAAKSLQMGKLNIFASLDLNYYIPISGHSSIGVGAYVDYGLPLYSNTPKYNEAYYKNSVLWINDFTDPSTVADTQAFTRAHVSVLDAFNLKAATADVPKVAVIKKFNYLSCGIRLSFQIGGELKVVKKHQYKVNNSCHCIFTN